MKKVVFSVVLLGWFQWALLQQGLVINGNPVAGLSTTLVEGNSYIPVSSLAEVLAASYDYDAQAGLLVFEYASRYVSLRVYPDAIQATQDTQALEVDGRRYESFGGVIVNGVSYIPLKPVIAALGGGLYYSQELQKVIVTFVRARMRSAYVQPLDDYDRLVFDFEGYTPHQMFYSPTLNTLQLRFAHVEALNSQSFVGQRFTQGMLQTSSGIAEVVLQLQPSIRVESYTTPTPGGFSLVIDLLEEIPVTASETVVLDPGHGGGDPGLTTESGRESDLNLKLGQGLQMLLNQQGIESQLTRDNNLTLAIQPRSDQGIGASLFLSVHVADIAPGSINIYYLAEASDSAARNIAIQRNAQQALSAETTDSLRRRLLLQYVPDLALGQRYATMIADTLRQNPGFTINHVAGLPLKVLEGAAGRGVLIEFSATDLADADLASFLSAAVLTVLAQ